MDPIFAEDGVIEVPSSDNIKGGLLPTGGIPRAWLNWIINLLHTTYVTGVYYINRIAPKESGGMVAITNYENTVVYQLIDTDTDTVQYLEGILVSAHAIFKTRIRFNDGPSIRFNLSQFAHMTYAGPATKSYYATFDGQNKLVSVYTGLNYFYYDLEFPYNETDGTAPLFPKYIIGEIKFMITPFTASAGSTVRLSLIKIKRFVHLEAQDRETEVAFTQTDLNVSGDGTETSHYRTLTLAGPTNVDEENYFYQVRIKLNMDADNLVMCPLGHAKVITYGQRE